MIKTNEDLFVKQYLDFLHSRTKEMKISENISRVTTPLLDKNSDAIEVYVVNKNNNYEITDDGYIINDLESSGLTIENGSLRHKYLHNILNNYGVQLGRDKRIFVVSDGSDLMVKFHMLTQAMIKISDLYFINKKNVQSLFTEDVKAFFDDKDIRYVQNISFLGKSKLQNHYDFVITKSKKMPERIISTTQNLDSNFTKMAIFSWEDIKKTRPEDSTLYVMFDDRNAKEARGMRTALESYGAKVLNWTNRDDYVEALTA